MKIRRRRKNNSLFIIIFLMLLTGITIGYATLSERLQITGTANANGKFDVGFISSKIIDAKGINVVGSKTQISEDKNTLYIDIKDLQYPGAGATVSCVIKNNGTVPAKLKDVVFTGNDDKDINVIFLDSSKKGQTIQPNDMWTIKFAVTWNIDSTIQTNKTVSFSCILEYEQDVVEYEPSI